MQSIFPEPIRSLPEADLPFSHYQAWLLQGQDQQIVFMQFDEDIDVPEHAHESQWGVVLEGKLDIAIGGVQHTFTKGDQYFIEKGERHSSKIYAGYADLTFFNQKDRYKAK